MAWLNYTVIALVLTMLPNVQNAPSPRKTRDNNTDRLIFPDEYLAINNSPRPRTRTVTSNLPLPKSRISTAEQFVKPVSQNNAQLYTGSSSGMEDERQNWGFIVNEMNIDEDESYYNRPLALPRNIDKPSPLKPNKEPRKKVTVKKVVSQNENKAPNPCDMASILCCGAASGVAKCLKTENCYIREDLISNVCNPQSLTKSLSNVVLYYKGTDK